jgi:hypothetical protein
MTTKPPLQKILEGILHTKDENKKNHESTEVLKLRRRTVKYTESSNELAAHTGILKQQKKI